MKNNLKTFLLGAACAVSVLLVVGATTLVTEKNVATWTWETAPADTNMVLGVTGPTNGNGTARQYPISWFKTFTNRPALYVDRSNVLSGLLTFPSSSNAVTVYPGGADWLLVSATPISLTNCVGAIAGYVCSATIISSNSSAATLTNFCTIPNAIYEGANGVNQNSNAVTVASGKQAKWRVTTQSNTRTNVSVSVEQ